MDDPVKIDEVPESKNPRDKFIDAEYVFEDSNQSETRWKLIIRITIISWSKAIGKMRGTLCLQWDIYIYSSSKCKTLCSFSKI